MIRNKIFTREEVYKNIRDILVEALTIEPEEVREESYLVKDLNAESIDFLDISFRLEDKFKIKIRDGEFMPTNADSFFDNTKFYDSSRRKVTNEGIAHLRKVYPRYNWNRFEQNPLAERILTPINVKNVIDYVEKKLKEGAKNE